MDTLFEFLFTILNLRLFLCWLLFMITLLRLHFISYSSLFFFLYVTLFSLLFCGHSSAVYKLKTAVTSYSLAVTFYGYSFAVSLLKVTLDVIPLTSQFAITP